MPCGKLSYMDFFPITTNLTIGKAGCLPGFLVVDYRQVKCGEEKHFADAAKAAKAFLRNLSSTKGAAIGDALRFEVMFPLGSTLEA